MGDGDWAEIDQHSAFTPGGIAERAQLGRWQRGPNRQRRAGLTIMLAVVLLMLGAFALIALAAFLTA